MRKHPACLAALVAVATLGAGCATAPKNTQLTLEQWRASAPLRLDFKVYEPTALLPYKPMGESATLSGLGSSGNGAVLVLLTLPVWLAVDAGRAAAQAGRKQQAAAGNRQLEDRWHDAVDPEQFRLAFERGVREALPGVELASGVAPASGGSGKVLAGIMHFSLRSDGRALLVHVLVRMQDVPTDALKCEGLIECMQLQATLRGSSFATHFFYHSEVLPDAAAAQRTVAMTRDTQSPARAFPVRLRDRAPARAVPARRAAPASYAPRWLANDAQPLRKAFADAAASLHRLTRLAIANEALPPRDRMTLGHALFPYFHDGMKFVVVQEDGGRRVLRSRASPVRGVFRSADGAAGHWFDVPATGEEREKYTAVLMDMQKTLATAYREN